MTATQRLYNAMSTIAALCLLSCSPAREKYVVGVSQCSEDIWRDKLCREIREATYTTDDIRLAMASASDDDRRQSAQIDSLAGLGIDLLIVSPNQLNTVTPAIDRAYDSGIPVILFDRKTGSGKYTAFIGADNVKIGRTMGEYVAARLGGCGTVAEITGLEGSSPAIERHRGFAEALARHPGIRIVATERGNWQEGSGRKAAERIFASGLRPDFIFAHNDRMAHGAWKAARRHGLVGHTRFVGIDALPGKGGGISLVRDGVLEASYIYPTRGDLVCRLARSILAGKPYERDNYMKAALVTKDNAETMLLQAEEMGHMSGRIEELHGMMDFFFAQYGHQKVYFILCSLILLLATATLAVLYRAALARRRMEHRVAEAKMDLFTGMGHDLRTPLTLIADPVERILDDDNLSQRQRAMLLIVRRNAGLLLRMVSEILDLGKVQGGKMELSLSHFNLADAARQWTESFRPAADSAGVALAFRAGGEVDICADYYKVERICYNLTGNAIKYNRRGGSVMVAVDSDGRTATITVADTGIGMDKAAVRHAFDKFFRAATSAGGTGIGLAIVKAFAELHGGRATVASTPGAGSTFTVELPLGQLHAESAEAWNLAADGGRELPPTAEDDKTETDIITSEGEPEGLPLALVVDDSADMRSYIARLLEGRCRVAEAADGSEGLDAALRMVPDIIVCDVKMPKMDGLEMCRSVKEATATSHVPVVLLTSRAGEDSRAEGYDCGADAYITKPFSGKVLLSRVQNLLDGRRRLKYAFEAGARQPQPEQAACDPSAGFLADFRQAVLNNLADSSLSVETLGAELGLSRVQLYRKVKSLTGSSPVEIIRITRLQRADHLLKTTDKTIAEISYDVGFSSPSYFSKCFRDYFGAQPGEVRDRKRGLGC